MRIQFKTGTVVPRFTETFMTNFEILFRIISPYANIGNIAIAAYLAHDEMVASALSRK